MTAPYVLVGVDGSAVAVRALDRAADEAARRRTALRLVYAVPDRDEAAPVLASARTRLRARHPGLPVAATAAGGGAVRALVRESAGASLTVVGAGGLGAVAGALFGSVSLRLAARPPGPLLVVRGARTRDEGCAVLLGLESDAEADAAAYAFAEAERRGARLRVFPNSRTATGAGRPDPVRALLAATREASVAVVEAHRRTHRFGPPLGQVAHALLHHSHCPVLVVPAPPV